MDSVEKVSKSSKSYKPVGKCIYCGSTENLGNEHIIPFGLNGQWILPKSSCNKCGEITAKFEKELLRGPFLEARTSLGLKTRNKEHRPERLPLKVKKDGKEEVLLLPPKEHFPTICFLEYPLPAYIDGRSYETGVGKRAYSFIGLSEPDEFVKKHGPIELEIRSMFDNIESFPRFLAKIAYGFIVAHFGLDSLEESFLPKIITGEDKQIAKYVGTFDDKIMRAENTIYHVMWVVSEKREIMVRIKLFSYTDAPEYLVVVGILKEEAYKSHLLKDNLVSLVDCNM